VRAHSADGIEKLYCECSLSDYLKFEDYYYTICPLRCPAIQNPTGSDLVNKEAKAPSLIFCHNKHSVNNASNLIKNSYPHSTNCVRMKHFGVNL
jgi:hypothetical protein